MNHNPPQIEDHYRIVCELASDYADVLRVAPDGTLTREWVNESFTRITGYTLDELPAQDGWQRLVHPDDLPIFRRQLAKLLAGQPDVSEYRIVTKQGEVRWLRARGRPIWDETEGRVVRYVGAAQDITEQVQAEQALQQRQRQLESLHYAGQAIGSSLDLDEVLCTILEEVRRLLGAVGCSVWLIDSATGELVCQQAADLGSQAAMRGWRLACGEGVAGWVAANGQSLVVPDAHADERYVRRVEQHIGLALRSILSVPLRAQDAVIGTLQAVDTRVGRFGPADLAVLEPLAASAAIAIQNARLFEQAQHEIAERKRAEQEIGRLNQYLGGIIENANIWLNVLDAGANVVIWNTAAEELSGYSRAEVVGHARIWEWLYPDPTYRDEVYSAAVAIIQEGQEEQDSYTTIRCKDGRTRIISWNSRRLLDERGAPMGSIALGRDITERRRDEEEIQLRNRELALLNRVIAASAAEPEPVTILETACRELAAAFDLPQAAAALLNQDKTAAVVVAEYLAEGRPSAIQGIIPVTDNPSFHYLLSRKAPLVVEDAQHDPRLAPMHQALRERGTVSLLMVPLVAEGEVLGSLGLDASQPRRFSAEEVSLAWSVADQAAGALARARLAQAHLRLSAAVEQAAESIAITDTQGVILYVNPAFERTTGYHAAEVLGTPLFLSTSLFLPTSLHLPPTRGEEEGGSQQEEALYERRWKTIQAGQAWHGRLSVRRKDGTLYTSDESVTPIRDEGGAIVNYVSLHRDVTGELQQEEQYRQAQKMEAVGQLTAGIAHDFNNLLTAINGFAELMQFQLPPDDPCQELAARVLGSGRRAADLVRQLLAFSRKQIIHPQVLNLNAAVADLDKLLGRIIGEHITMQSVLAPGLWPVKIDPAQFEQVVVNLAVNARDAMPGGGRLTIQTANAVLDEAYAASHLGVAPGEYVLLTVSDTGVGMSGEVQAHLFEPFFTTKGPGKGTGLGLATVFGIVKQSGGHIWVYSEPGRGSAFKIYLPRAETDVASQQRLEGGGQPPTGQETILLVEDNPEVRDLARQVLARQGYTVLEAAEGEEALRRAEAHAGPIHLLLTDVVMPGMTGKALAERLGGLRPDLKVLYMSGYTDETIAHHGVLEPGVAFLQKPFTSFNLALKVRQVLNQARPTQPA